MKRIILCLVLLWSFVYIICQDTDPLFKKKKDGCGVTYVNPFASFKLNDSNLSKTECKWFIEPVNTTHVSGQISLFLHSIFLHEDDEITLYKSVNESDDDEQSIIEPIHANNGSITIITEEKFLVVKLKGTDKHFLRTFEATYDTNTPCTFPITPQVTRMYSPIPTKLSNMTKLDCVYTWNEEQVHFPRFLPTFVFEQFNFSKSKVNFKDSTHDGDFPPGLEMDIFPTSNTMTMTVSMQLPTTETFCLKRHDVDASCSKHVLIQDHTFEPFQSPVEEHLLNNGSYVNECRWIFEHNSKDKVLSVDLKSLHFDHALDVIAINDGASEISPPLLQVTTTNQNYSMNQIIRSKGPYIWIAFKPMTYGSRISGQVTEHGEGGYYRGSGTIIAKSTTADDTVFQLEVGSDEIVYLDFISSSMKPNALLQIYDGFDKAHLLTAISNLWYPILSQSSKMMIIAKGFDASTFTANFKGVHPGCFQMSSVTNENYILSGNCNATCRWIIPPQNVPGSEFLLNLQYLSLLEGDSVDILQLDAGKTSIGVVYPNATHVPQLVIPASVGAQVVITRAPCAKEKEAIALVGHSSYVPACGKNLSVDALAQFQVTSPLYPDTYPIFASCVWKISAPKNSIVHFAFNALSLAPNHCIKVNSSSVTQQYTGSELPEDLILSDQSTIEFDSSNCGKPRVPFTALESSGGFVMNGTVADCGALLSNKPSGEFSVEPNKTFCIWKVSVPETDSSASDVNIISFTVSKKDSIGNYELFVHDGSSVRENVIKNDSFIDVWSRTSNLIFIYKRTDVTKPSTILTVKYSTISCNASSQCDNQICLHPDWLCNGKNDCGDFSDERNCVFTPVPPVIKQYGYSSLAFWLTIFIMLAVGIGMGVGGPMCYDKYKNGQYRRFGDFSVVQ